MPTLLLTAALAAATWAGFASRAAADHVDAHVVVTRVAPGFAAEKAGLRPGDTVRRWEQGPQSGGLASPFELVEVELERGPRGAVRLLGARGGAPLDVSLFPDDWGLETRPALPDEVAAEFEAAWGAIEAGSTADGLARLRALRPRLRAFPNPDLEPWILLSIARAEARRKDVDAAAGALEEAAAAARASRRPQVEAQVLAHLGAAWRAVERNPEAAAAYERALAARRQAGPDGLATASLADPIGTVAHGLGQGEDAPRQLVAALAAVQEQLAPESLALARSLLALGRLQRRRADAIQPYARALGLAERLAPDSLLAARALSFSAVTESDLPRRESLLRRALAIQERLAPETIETAVVLTRLAGNLDLTGEPARALEHHLRAVAIVERVAPGTESHGQALNGLGGYWSLHGDLVQAEAYFRRALEIDEKRRPNTEWVAARLYNLGEVLRTRRDFAPAEAALRRGLALSDALSPRGELAGRLLFTLGRTLHEKGDDAAAEPVLRRSLDVLTDTAPAQVQYARESLGAVLAATGRREEAAALYRQNLEYARQTTQSRYVLAEAHQRLGDLALGGGDLDAAESHHRAALDLRRNEVPDSIWQAESAHALGAVQRRRGRREDALALFREAVASLEAQGRRLGGSEETRAAFRAHYQEYYRDLEELLLELGHTVAAFEAVERSRARSLLALLASRDVGLGGHLEAGLERERRQADSGHDRALRAFHASGQDEAQRAKRLADLEEARRRQDDVRARIRAAQPRLSAFRDPEPLDLAGVRTALGPGTLLLAYSVGAAARVYAVGPGPDDFAVVPLPEGDAAIRTAVEVFRRTIDERRGAALRGPLTVQSRRLSGLLLAPVAERIGRAERLVVMPDGVLHLVPFAALVDPSARATTRYLVEAKPLHTASSMTLSEVLARRWTPDVASDQVVGFGDPAYGSASGAEDRSRAPALVRAAAAGLRLDPLPATRDEVAALRALSSGAQVFLGAEATEEKAKALGPSARVVHFACHGFLDERMPLESGLALTIPAAAAPRENGLLQAWEVFESVRVDAELVTLSACQTGLGKEMAGEGLLGLTWAFQYAGARSVLASLWEVSDASTAEFMTRFYSALAAGAAKSEALRRAQLSLLRRPRTAAPFHWAAFTLSGADR